MNTNKSEYIFTIVSLLTRVGFLTYLLDWCIAYNLTNGVQFL